MSNIGEVSFPRTQRFFLSRPSVLKSLNRLGLTRLTNEGGMGFVTLRGLNLRIFRPGGDQQTTVAHFVEECKKTVVDLLAAKNQLAAKSQKPGRAKFKILGKSTVLSAAASLPFGATAGILLGCLFLNLPITVAAIAGAVLVIGVITVMRYGLHRARLAGKATKNSPELETAVTDLNQKIISYYSDLTKREALALVLSERSETEQNKVLAALLNEGPTDLADNVYNIIYAYQILGMLKQAPTDKEAQIIPPEVISPFERQTLISKLDPKLEVVRSLHDVPIFQPWYKTEEARERIQQAIQLLGESFATSATKAKAKLDKAWDTLHAYYLAGGIFRDVRALAQLKMDESRQEYYIYKSETIKENIGLIMKAYQIILAGAESTQPGEIQALIAKLDGPNPGLQAVVLLKALLTPAPTTLFTGSEPEVKAQLEALTGLYNLSIDPSADPSQVPDYIKAYRLDDENTVDGLIASLAAIRGKFPELKPKITTLIETLNALNAPDQD